MELVSVDYRVFYSFSRSTGVFMHWQCAVPIALTLLLYKRAEKKGHLDEDEVIEDHAEAALATN
jgi:hypothetical protein